MDFSRLSELGRYILEEWAEDYRKGLLDRREFLRRVAVFAGSTAAALPLLRALGDAAEASELADATAQAPPPQQTQGITVPPDDPAIQAEIISFPAGGIMVRAYLARPRNRLQAPGIVVVHENRGLVEHIKDVARRLSKVGYVALAVDLVSHQGGTPRRSRACSAGPRPRNSWGCWMREYATSSSSPSCSGTAWARWGSASVEG